MQNNKKNYDKLMKLLQFIGDFDKQIEVYIHECKEEEKEFCIKLWCFDKNENIFIICADSSKKTDLTIVEKQTENGIEIYDFSLAKNFDINLDNVDYLRFLKEYGFKFGRLISDQKSFYSLFLGDNVGFQIQLDYATNEKNIEIQELLDLLNKLETKPNLQVFMDIVGQILRSHNIEVKIMVRQFGVNYLVGGNPT